MNQIQTVSLFGRPVSLYALLAALLCLCAALVLPFFFRRRGLSCRKAFLYAPAAAVLGVLESMGVLAFRMNGGANSQIYIYVNQIQPIRNILKRPWNYENRLLKMVAERHAVSVKMLTYLYENDFTSEQRWDLLEDYFLGRIPEEVEKEVEKEKAKKN